MKIIVMVTAMRIFIAGFFPRFFSALANDLFCFQRS